MWTKFFRLIILGTLIFMGCNENDQQSNTGDLAKTGNYKEPVRLDSIPVVRLSDEANKEIMDWQEFMTVKTEIDKFKETRLQEIINNAPTLEKAINRMTDSIPKRYQTPAILGRIKVLNTEINILNQEIRLKNHSPQSVNRSAENVYSALMNLEIQLNEIYLNPLEKIEAEMKQAVSDSTENKEISRSREPRPNPKKFKRPKKKGLNDGKTKLKKKND